ncbi:MAG: hypothetical protein WD533_06405 [Dehalococcoidia bacterium]
MAGKNGKPPEEGDQQPLPGEEPERDPESAAGESSELAGMLSAVMADPQVMAAIAGLIDQRVAAQLAVVQQDTQAELRKVAETLTQSVGGMIDAKLGELYQRFTGQPLVQAPTPEAAAVGANGNGHGPGPEQPALPAGRMGQLGELLKGLQALNPQQAAPQQGGPLAGMTQLAEAIRQLHSIESEIAAPRVRMYQEASADAYDRLRREIELYARSGADPLDVLRRQPTPPPPAEHPEARPGSDAPGPGPA